MYCIHNGKSCLMVWDRERGEYVYIPEKKWDKMTTTEKHKYRETHMSTEYDLQGR